MRRAVDHSMTRMHKARLVASSTARKVFVSIVGLSDRHAARARGAGECMGPQHTRLPVFVAYRARTVQHKDDVVGDTALGLVGRVGQSRGRGRCGRRGCHSRWWRGRWLADGLLLDARRMVVPAARVQGHATRVAAARAGIARGSLPEAGLGIPALLLASVSAVRARARADGAAAARVAHIAVELPGAVDLLGYAVAPARGGVARVARAAHPLVRVVAQGVVWGGVVAEARAAGGACAVLERARRPAPEPGPAGGGHRGQRYSQNVQCAHAHGESDGGLGLVGCERVTQAAFKSNALAQGERYEVATKIALPLLRLLSP